MASRCTAVVVAYHRPDSLRELLDGLAGVPVVVVNVDGDENVAQVATGRNGVRVIGCGNSGFAAAVNGGTRLVESDLVAFMNDDIVCTAEDVAALARTVGDGADVVVPQVLASDGSVEPTVLPLPSVKALLLEWALLPDLPPAWVRGAAPVEKWRVPFERETVAAASAMFVVTTTALLRSHPLPEAYFLYWEEVEWFWRLRRAGAVVAYEPAVVIRHRGGRGDVRPEKSALLARNAVRCIRRTRGRAHAALAWPVVIGWQARLLAVEAIRAMWVRHRGDLLSARLAGLRAATSAWREIFA